MKYLMLALVLALPGAASAEDRTEAADVVMAECFAGIASPDAELSCLGTAVRACTPDVQNPANPDLMPCIEAETAVWKARGDDRLRALEEVIRASEGTDEPCTPSVDACVEQLNGMARRMEQQGEAACEEAAQIAAVDGVPDLGRAACMLRETALRAVRLADLRRDAE